jgi:hypothetical protein
MDMLYWGDQHAAKCSHSSTFHAASRLLQAAHLNPRNDEAHPPETCPKVRQGPLQYVHCLCLCLTCEVQRRVGRTIIEMTATPAAIAMRSCIRGGRERMHQL